MIICWDVCVEYFEDRPAVEKFLTERSTLWYNPGGTTAISFWLGPGSREQAELSGNGGRPDAELRIDLDQATGCGAARWFDGDLMAVETNHGMAGFGTWTGSFEPVPYNVGRVSFMTALRLAFAYAETGERPTVPVSVGKLSWVDCNWMN